MRSSQFHIAGLRHQLFQSHPTPPAVGQLHSTSSSLYQALTLYPHITDCSGTCNKQVPVIKTILPIQKTHRLVTAPFFHRGHCSTTPTTLAVRSWSGRKPLRLISRDDISSLNSIFRPQQNGHNHSPRHNVGVKNTNRIAPSRSSHHHLP
jgi:hypothetical protein